MFYHYCLSLYRKKGLDSVLSFNYHLVFLFPFRSKHLVRTVCTCCLYFFSSNSFFNKFISAFCFRLSTKATLVWVTMDGSVGKSCLSYLASQKIRQDWLFPHCYFTSCGFQDTGDYTLYFCLFLNLFFSSSSQFLTFVMSQSCSLGPLLFAVYILPVNDTVQTIALYTIFILWMFNFICAALASPLSDKFIHIWHLNSIGLNCTGSLTCRFSSVNIYRKFFWRFLTVCKNWQTT